MTTNPAGLPLHPAEYSYGRVESGEEKDARISKMLRVSADYRKQQAIELAKRGEGATPELIRGMKPSHRLIAWILKRYSTFEVSHVAGNEIADIRRVSL